MNAPAIPTPYSRDALVWAIQQVLETEGFTYTQLIGDKRTHPLRQIRHAVIGLIVRECGVTIYRTGLILHRNKSAIDNALMICGNPRTYDGEVQRYMALLRAEATRHYQACTLACRENHRFARLPTQAAPIDRIARANAILPFTDVVSGLSRKNRSILEHVAHGATDKEIMAALGLGRTQIRTGITLLTRKAGIAGANRNRLMAWYWKGLLREMTGQDVPDMLPHAVEKAVVEDGTQPHSTAA